jgi:hypothetical protein
MLNKEEFEYWCGHISLSDEALNLINQIRSAQPVRAVKGSKGNVVGRYPSPKMGVTIQFESHKNELAFIHTYEDDDDVLEYYDQSSTIKLSYEAASGRHLGVLHTPDFFVIRADSAGWEECKNEEALVQLALKSPNRYVQDSNGGWHCPPGETYAEEFSLYYRIRSSEEFNWIYQRNLEFLEDYYRDGSLTVASEIRALVLARVAEMPGIPLEKLHEDAKHYLKLDEIFKLITLKEIYVNLQTSPLIEQNKVSVYLNQETAIAHENLLQVAPLVWLDAPRFIDLKAGTSIQWNGKGWTIVNVGEALVSLMSETKAVTEILLATFERLVQENRISGLKLTTIQNVHPEIESRMRQADKHAFAEANRRCDIVRAYLSGEPLSLAANIPERTLRRWAAQYRRFQQIYGNGYPALLPFKRSGNTNDRLPSTTRALIYEFIENDYESSEYSTRLKAEASL